jgi:hypothetical protein
MRLAVATLCVLTASGCGSEMLRTGRSPMFLTVNNIETTNGATDETGTNLLSDVQTIVERTINGQAVRVPTIFNDSAVATLGISAKDPSATTSVINSVTITRYRIAFRRIDGRNTPGVDVPFGWDGATSVTIPAGGTGGIAFEIVRHSTKQEPPLRNLINNGGVQFIYTIAEITFFGRDQNGNEVTASGQVEVAFSDFADPL